MKCPLCGGTVFQHPAANELRVCNDCGETLELTELVKRATKRTRRAYLKVQGDS